MTTKQDVKSTFTIPMRANRPQLVLAEDDDEVRLALADLFAHDGFDVTCVSDGELLVDHLGRCEARHQLPDVIVTDHRMPGYSSLDILEGLRLAGWNVPVLVITAFGREVQDLAENLGARAVFEKPFDPDDLRTAVLHWIDWSKQHRDSDA